VTERPTAAATERAPEFRTLSGRPVKRIYGPEDLSGLDPARDLGNPGEYPYTRGPYDTMYRGRLWTMRQFAGFGTAAETNARFKYLLEQGQTGLSVAFDYPRLLGLDSDDPRAEGEVGKMGVAVDTLDDMERLFAGIPLDRVSTSMTINSGAIVMLCMYLGVAERQGVSWDRVAGTIQNDILKEYTAQKTYIFPPRPSMRLITDMFAFCSERVPRWNSVSISGYHIREAGATAGQELAFTLADGFAYVEAGRAAGLPYESFVPRLSFFFDVHMDFFEEIAKLRAARRIWARRLRERYGIEDPRCLRLRFHAQTAGCSLTAQQPLVNVVRTAIEALAGVLGGCQSLHTNSFDEALALPSEEAVRIALRTQQVIAEETGVTNTVDPMAGSYFLESLTNDLEREAGAYFDKIEQLGGVIPAIEAGFFQREIADASYQYQQRLQRGELVVVGVNKYTLDEREPVEILRIDPEVERAQVKRLQAHRARRDAAGTEAALAAVARAAAGTANLMPPILEALKAGATFGEVCDRMRAIFGEYVEPIIF
jgi:methylmalonyl-CoA mutase N-terminal domain/subunit